MRFSKRLWIYIFFCSWFSIQASELDVVKILKTAPVCMRFGLDGIWWYGLNDGLYRFDGTALEKTEPLGIGKVQVLLEDSSERLWIGSEHGLYFRDSALRFGQITLDETWPKVLSLCEADGSVWVGLEDGLLRLGSDGRKARRLLKKPYGITVLFHDMGGSLWAGTRAGLFQVEEVSTGVRLKPVRGSVSAVQAISETANGTLVVATDAGLSLLDQDREAMRSIDEQVRSVVAMGHDRGVVWLMTAQGLYAAYDDGALRQQELAKEAVMTAVMDPYGNMWFAGREGAIYRYGRHSPGPVMRIKSLMVNGEAHTDFGSTVLCKEGDRLHIRLQTLDPVAPGGTYSFRYDDGAWQDIGETRNLVIDGLKVGVGTLEFRCIHESGKVLAMELPLAIETDYRQKLYGLGPWLLVVTLVLVLLLVLRRKKARGGDGDASQRVRAYIAKSSEELHEPLTSLIDLSESLLSASSGPLDGKLRESLSMVAASGRRLRRMVDNLTGLAQVNTGSLPMRQQRLDLYALVQVVLTRAEKGDSLVGLINVVPKDLPDVLGDEDLVLRILNVLVSNGIQHTDAGEIRVSARHEGSMVCLSVADTGRCLNEAQIRALFEDETQTGSNPRLGLSYMRQLARQQGGELWGEPRSKGCAFFVTLPVYDEGVSGSDTAAFRVPDDVFEELYGSKELETNKEASHCILVVDDDRINRQVLFNHLALQNYRILVASGGEEALAMVDKEAVDLVLLDIMMPRVNGYEVCERLRQRWPIQELPVIFLTAKNQESDLLTGYSLGANDFISKPVQQTEVLARVKTHLALLDVHRNLENQVVQRTDALLQAQKQMINQEKMASLGTLTAGIAHELKNPLNFVNNFSVFAEDLCKDVREAIESAREHLPATLLAGIIQDFDEMEENISYIHQYGVRANGIIESMMDLAGNPRDERKPTDINALVEEFSDFVFKGKKAALNRIRIQKKWDPSVGKQEVIAQALSRVVINIVNNAMEAMSSYGETHEDYRGALCISTQMGSRHYSIEVADNGPGIPANMFDQIFTPFFTSKPPGTGNIGLGLAICYDIVTNQHGGEISVHSQEGRGATFIIKLPITRP